MGCALAVSAVLCSCSSTRRMGAPALSVDSVASSTNSSEALTDQRVNIVTTDRVEKLTVTLDANRDTVGFEREITVTRDNERMAFRLAERSENHSSSNSSSTFSVETVEVDKPLGWFDTFRIKAFNWLLGALAVGAATKFLTNKLL